MNRRFFLVGASALAIIPAIGNACDKAVEYCGVPVPNNDFGKGNITRAPDYQIQACLPNDVWQAIQPKDGSAAKWVFRLVSFDNAGDVRWHASKTMKGNACKSQGVYRGTHVFVYVTCVHYTGWYTTGPIGRSGVHELHTINWEVSYKWLDQNFGGKLS